MARKKASKKSHNVAKTGVAIGALAAGAAVAYYFYGPQGKTHRTQIKGWTLKAKGEVMDRLEKLPHVDKATYYRLVEEMSKKYKKAKSLKVSDVERLARELKAGWNQIEKEMKSKASKKATKKRKSTKKRTKKSTRRKTTKKTSRKK